MKKSCSNCTHTKKRVNQLPCKNCFNTKYWEPMPKITVEEEK